MLQIKAKDFLAVKEATISLDGITVVSGVNGSGKSTLAKSAYELLFTALNYDDFVERKIERDINEIRLSLRSAITNLSGFVSRGEMLHMSGDIRDGIFSTDNEKTFVLIDKLIDLCQSVEGSLSSSKQKYYDSFTTVLKSSLDRQYQDEYRASILLELLKQKIIAEQDSSTLMKTERLMDVFQSQWVDLFGQKLNPSLFNVYENDIPIVDGNRNVVLLPNSIKNVFYIDTPMCLSEDRFTFFGIRKKHWLDLNATLKNQAKMGESFDYRSKEDLGILKGDFEWNEDKETFMYRTPDSGPVFDLIKNGATGLKSFVILQTLYRKNLVHSKTLLILDEPEAHLHPQWIVHFARFIVLLRKETGCSFLISSHSTDMINSLSSMSEKELKKGAVFYLAQPDRASKFMYNFHNCGNNIEPLFEVFNKSFRMMDRYTDDAI